MTKEEYIDKLKREFIVESNGYDPDEDRGYFLEWLLDRLFKLEIED